MRSQVSCPKRHPCIQAERLQGRQNGADQEDMGCHWSSPLMKGEIKLYCFPALISSALMASGGIPVMFICCCGGRRFGCPE